MQDAERIVAEEERPDTNEMSEGGSADRSYLPLDSGTDINDDDVGRNSPPASQGHLRRRAWRGVILLWLHWHRTFQSVEGIRQQADLVKEAGKGGGIYCPYIARKWEDDWIFTEVDEQNIPVPPTYDEVVAAPRFRNVRFQSANHRDEETFYWSLKLRGLRMMYRIWTACNILSIKAEQFRGINHQKDIAFVSDTIFRCIALGLNCDYMTFYRTDVLIGRNFLKAAIICVQGVKEVDTPLTQWCRYRNTHLPTRYIEKINRTEETPDSLLERFRWRASRKAITASSHW